MKSLRRCRHQSRITSILGVLFPCLPLLAQNLVPNDHFADRLALTGWAVSLTATNTGASTESGEPIHAGTVGGASVWWDWIAPTNGGVAVEVTPRGFNALVGVYTGTSLSILEPIGSIKAGAGVTSTVTFHADQGTNYLIVVDGEAGSSGSFDLSLRSGFPEFLLIPTNTLVGRADSATLVGAVSGTEPIAYQWFFQGQPLPSETNATLTLSKVLEAQTGSYRLMASNAVGAVSAEAVVSMATNRVSFGVTELDVMEGSAQNLLVMRTGFTNALTVLFTVGGTAVAGVDYSPLSGTIRFAQGATSSYLYFQPLDDAVEEAPQTVVLTLLPEDHYVLDTNGVATMTLTDDDPNIRASVTSSIVRGGDGTPVAFVLRRTGDVARPLEVGLSMEGTARNGVDYEFIPVTVTIPAGETNLSVWIRPIGGDIVDKTVQLRVMPSGAYVVRVGTTTTQLVRNHPPRANLIAPKPWQTVADNVSVELEALASDFDGSVASVEFMDGKLVLGRVDRPPFRWTFTPSRGLHHLMARATDNQGTTALSEGVPMVVGETNGAESRLRNLQPNVPGQTISATANGNSSSPVISLDGRKLAFVSLASDLTLSSPHRNSLGPALNVYVQDVDAGTNLLVSQDGAGIPANGDAYAPVLSASGDWVVFESVADNLVTYDENQASDVFARNLLTGQRVLVSAKAGWKDRTANGASTSASISADGRRVVFESVGSDFVSGDTNGVSDIFVRDLPEGTNVLVSVRNSGSGSGKAASTSPVISEDGRRVAFVSAATDLVAGVSQKPGHVYLRDLDAAKTVCVSAELTATLGFTSILCYDVSMSADGRHIAFKTCRTLSSQSAWLVRYEVESNTMDVISTNAIGPLNDGNDGTVSSLSADGQTIAYEVGGHYWTNWIYAWSGLTRSNTLVSGLPGSTSTGLWARSPVLSRDGRQVAFSSTYPGLVEGVDGEGVFEFIRQLPDGPVRLAVRDTQGSSVEPGGASLPQFTADGRRLLFASSSPNLAANDSNNASDVFLRDLENGTNQLISARAAAVGASAPGVDVSFSPAGLSADGRFLAFSSLSSGLTSQDTNGLWDVFVWDRVTGVNTLVSINTNGWAASGASHSPVISANGRVVAFASNAGDLTDFDTNKREDLFVRDLDAGRTVLVSSNRLGVASTQFASRDPVISADGKWVGFVSESEDLVETPHRGQDLFLRDWRIGTLLLVTNQFISGAYYPNILPISIADGPAATYMQTGSNGVNLIVSDTVANTHFLNGPVLSLPSVTADGRFVACRLKDSARNHPIQVFSLAAGRNIAEADAMPTGLGHTNLLVSDTSVSANGMRVAYVCKLDRDPRDTNGTNDIYMWDQRTGLSSLASGDWRGERSGNAPASDPILSADGRFLAFSSRATNLVLGQTKGENLYVRDLESGLLWWVAGLNHGPGSGQWRRPTTFGQVGAELLFRSFSGDMASSGRGFPALLTFALLPVALQDLDGDAMDDAWEMRAWGNLGESGASDHDQDGMTDLQEYLAGTDPRLAASVLLVTFVRRDGEGKVLIQWPAVPGRRYSIVYDDSLEHPRWQPLANDLLPVNGMGSYTDEAPDVRQRFYRILASP